MSALTQLDKKSPAEIRDAIVALEHVMKQMPEHQIEIETIHHFGPGVYMREVRIPKGATVVGKIHKTEHYSILSQGELSVWTEGGMKRLKASHVVLSQPGMKRVGYAHEDTVWITVHPCEERDLHKLEKQLIAESFEEIASQAKLELEGGA